MMKYTGDYKQIFISKEEYLKTKDMKAYNLIVGFFVCNNETKIQYLIFTNEFYSIKPNNKKAKKFEVDY